nr:reverse transcriptase domain-containing protein [Tanacetum cinerariifolium]
MREGTFLGYKVDAGGVRVCPNKVEAVLSLPSPRCLKDMQKLNGNPASLNRFLSKFTEKSLPLFKTLKMCTKKRDFQWTAEAEMAFKKMKQWIAELPMLTAPKEKEELIMYLVAAKEAISAILMTERDGKQIPIYFVSSALQGLKVNYTPMEKLILALVTRRLLKWRFELEEHDINYRPRTSVKGQILADFIIERPEDDTLDTLMEDRKELSDPWILFTDGSSCINEYEALIAGLRIAGQMKVQNLQANVDSKLLANQVNEVYVAKESSMIKYFEKVKNLASTFKEFFIKQVPRGENKKANALSKIASTSFAHLSNQVLVEELKEKSIDKKEVLAVVEEERHTWMTTVYEYLTKGILLEEKRKAMAIHRKAGRYVVTNRTLNKKNPSSSHGCDVGSSDFDRDWHANLKEYESRYNKNNEALGINLDLVEEKREQETIQEARSKAKIEKYYNARVRNTSFRLGDLVYRNNEASHAKDGGKLRPK